MIIKQGDCLELLKDVPDGSIDAIICDLPYGVTQAPFDKKLPLEEMWTHFRRVTKKNAAVVLFSQQPFSAELVMSNKRNFKYVWTWHKKQCTGFLNAKHQPLRSCEDILVFYQALPTYNPQMRKGKPYKAFHSDNFTSNYGLQWKKIFVNETGDRYPTTLLEFPLPRFKDGHPQQKPTNLLEYLIKTYTNENETVLDATMGSGSTGVACVNTNRNFIGFELEEKFFNIAEKRISEAVAKREQSLF